MLNRLNEDIAECYRHAEECARFASAEVDPGLRTDFLDMKRRWLFLARSYEFSERLNSLTNEPDARANRRKLS